MIVATGTAFFNWFEERLVDDQGLEEERRRLPVVDVDQRIPS